MYVLLYVFSEMSMLSSFVAEIQHKFRTNAPISFCGKTEDDTKKKTRYTHAMKTELLIHWKHYTKVVVEIWLAFAIATFSMAVYFSHLENSSTVIIGGVLLVALYLFVIAVCIRQLIITLPIGMLMLLVPIAPLAILLLVVSLLPVIQKLG
jgi:uncharacterized membrane protein YeiB